MLRTLRQGSRLFMWIVILGVGAVFVLYLGFQGKFNSAPGPDVIVAVGKRHYDYRDVERVREIEESQFRRTLGKGFDPKTAQKFLVQQAVGSLMRNALLAQEAQRMGLVVSDEEVRAYLAAMPGAVDEKGDLDRRTITAYAERNFGSLKRFQEALRDQLLSQKLVHLITSSAGVSDAEARQALRYRKEEVSIAAVKLTGQQETPMAQISDAQVQELLKKDPDRVRKAYEARRSEFDRPEEVRARHILIRVPRNADAKAREAARKKIEAIRKRILAGADFATVAKEVSEDPQTREKGGDLGFFSRKDMVPAFDQAAFNLAPGKVSDVVETQYGFHLIQVEKKRPALVVPFEEAREKVARQLLEQDAARDEARKEAEALAGDVKAGGNLVDSARNRGLTLVRTGLFSRNPQGVVPEIGRAPEVMDAAFALQMKDASDPTVFDVGDAFVLIQLLDRKEPDAKALDALLPDERHQLLAQRRNAIETAWILQLRHQAEQRKEIHVDTSQFEKESQ